MFYRYDTVCMCTTHKHTAKKSSEAAAAQHKKGEEARILRSVKAVQAVIAYCETPGCRRKTLLAHFGEKINVNPSTASSFPRPHRSYACAFLLYTGRSSELRVRQPHIVLVSLSSSGGLLSNRRSTFRSRLGGGGWGVCRIFYSPQLDTSSTFQAILYCWSIHCPPRLLLSFCGKQFLVQMSSFA